MTVGWLKMFHLIDFQVKELNKRASGQAFEVILSPSTPDTKVDFPLSPNKKKETSLDEIKRKLEAAEERRKVFTATKWTNCRKGQIGCKFLVSWKWKDLFSFSIEPWGRSAETSCWETWAREGGHTESYGGELQLQQAGTGETQPEDGGKQREPLRSDGGPQREVQREGKRQRPQQTLLRLMVKKEKVYNELIAALSKLWTGQKAPRGEEEQGVNERPGELNYSSQQQPVHVQR